MSLELYYEIVMNNTNEVTHRVLGLGVCSRIMYPDLI
jgi:hypothetical protein